MAHDCKHCEGEARFGMTRRDVMRTSVGGFLGFAMARQSELFGAPRPEWFLPQDTRATSAKACIVLWMGGGPSQYETWDPKEGRDNGGPTKAIETSVKGIQYAENMQACAKQAQHIAVVRSVTSREGSHERGRYLLHTGYVPTGTVVHPSIGSVAAMEIGNRNLDLPSYISIGGGSEGAGFLPPEYNPFIVDNPGGKLPNLSYPQGITKDRFRARMALLNEHEKEFSKEHSSEETDRHKTAYEKADRLMHTPLLEAFDLSKEKPDLVKAYTGSDEVPGDMKRGGGGGRGGGNRFGMGCLLARRLVEAGVKFVEVNLGGWDTHQDNFTAVARNCKSLDPGMGTLIRDLNDRKMLKNTLVVWMGEFGRTPRVNANSGRDHYPRAWSVALAGGGIQGGRVIGATDKDGVEVKERPVTIPDLLATVHSTLGIDIKKKNISPLGRPIQITDNGTAVKELLT